MPSRPKRPCRHPGCPSLVDLGYCDKHRKANRKSYDEQRGTSSQRGYGGRWQKVRAAFLKRNPLCVKCMDEGRITAGTVVDHLIPHRGDPVLMWDEDNFQTLCGPHHNRDKQREEKRSPGAIRRA